MHRRTFIQLGLACLGGAGLVRGDEVSGETLRKWRVGVIGHTGRGNYGHGLDTVWKSVQGADIVGLADADDRGRSSAADRLGLGVNQVFSDYLTMIRMTRPEVITIGPRHADQHEAMCLAAIENGVRGIYIEKPFCRTPAEADRILAAAENRSVALAVAHRNRYHPVVLDVQKRLESGEFGGILEIRGRGKGDHRGGAEDLWVLGTHILNLMHFIGGDPVSCSAQILTQGRPVQLGDLKEGNEGLGLMAGDELQACYRMSRGFWAKFDSRVNDKTAGLGFMLEIVCSSASIRIYPDRNPVVYIRRGNPYQFEGADAKWVPWTTAGIGEVENNPELIQKVMTHVTGVENLLHCLSTGGTPLCDGSEGRMTVEMVHAVFQSHWRGGAFVTFPLQQRPGAESWIANPI